MKNKISLLICFLFTTSICIAQIKPAIMIIPADAWMEDNNFTKEINNQGSIEVVYDYEKALRENRDLKKIIDQISGLWGDRGYPLEDLSATLAEIKAESMEMNTRQLKDGSFASRNPIDVVFETASPDIKFTLDLSFIDDGFDKRCDFVITALDAYTNKVITSKQGTGNGDFSRTEVELAREMVFAHMDGFVNKVSAHFEKIVACQCREVRIEIINTDVWGEDLESEFGEDDEELNILIEDWLDENTTDGGANIRMVSENKMTCKQVMIPLFYDKVSKSGKIRKKKLNTKKFADMLHDYLDTFGIESKVVTKGLGRADIWLGTK